jgi:hypothetical protein
MHVGVVNGAEYAVFGRSGHGWDGDVSLPAVCRNQCGGVFLDASFQKCWHHVGCGCQCSGGSCERDRWEAQPPDAFFVDLS